MFKALILLNTIHLSFKCLMFVVANFQIISSASIYEAINNSIGILVMNSLHAIASKYFMVSFSFEFNDIQHDENFLILELDYQENYPIKQSYDIMMFLNALLQLIMILFENRFIMFIGSTFDVPEFILYLVLPFIVISVVMIYFMIFFSSNLIQFFSSICSKR